MAAIAQNAREPMDQGIQDYKSARYAEAATAFQKAVDLNPSDVTARLYLGTTLMSQYVPGAQSPENSEFARRAEAEFQEVLRLEPTDETALASLAALNYQEAQGMTDSTQKSAKLDESSSWYLRLIAADPRDKEAYYSLGVIGWMKWYPAWIQACVTLGMRPSDPGPLPPSAVKAELKNQYSSVIEHAISSLQKALEIDPQYDDAMAYMNLLIRERADLRDTPEDYRRDIEQADQWVQKALDTKRLKAQAALPQRIRVIGNVQQANLIRKVDPVYPQAAREAAIPR
ncbi:MAG TPA: tetratricopeptide repeat protein [Bryobacteraceae bacterium]|nr:tetratricopeptide repeat protein [Bryobacteraceae bacterium]